MAGNLERLAKNFETLGHHDIATGLTAWAEVAKKRGLEFASQPETESKTKEFTTEQKEAPKKKGYKIYPLTGLLIRDLKTNGRLIVSGGDVPDIDKIRSMRSEVAINPNLSFLINSNKKTLQEQEIMIENFSQKITKDVKGIKAIMGQVVDYTELAYKHFESTGEYIFEEPVRTNTPVEDYFYATVHLSRKTNLLGRPDKDKSNFEMYISGWNPQMRFRQVYAAPLIVPA